MSAAAVVVGVALALAGALPEPARSKEAMAATAHPLATAAALEILEDGGNAVDAAVAAAFAISVVEPFSAGIGGGGFAIIHLEPALDDPGTPKNEATGGGVFALDFREVAPQGATRDMYLDPATKLVKPGASVDGHLAVAVPGTVAGLAELHKKYGALPWRRVVKPSIDLARDGFAVSEHFVGAFAWRKDAMTRFPSTRAIFMKRGSAPEESVPLEAGDRLRQRELAKTLKDIAQDPRNFYEGKLADAIDADMRANGGVLTKEDLKAYAPRWREPLCGDYKGARLCTMPPPSSGGVHLFEILNLVDGVDLGALGWHNVDGLHRLIESMRIAYADRAVHLGDPAFAKVPVAELTSKAYAELRKREIDPLKARKSSDIKAGTPEMFAAAMGTAPKREPEHTSHLTVVDGKRNAVSLTFTVNYGFGSGVVVGGVLLNDEMDDFAAAPGVPNSYGLVGGEANSVQPGKIPLSSMTPLVATKDGKFFMTAGAPGGATIITTVLQTVIHVMDFNMDAQAAIAAPRLHHQWLPDSVRLETLGFDDGTIKALQARGHTIQMSDGWGNGMCIVERNGVLEGGADPRGEGEARGL